MENGESLNERTVAGKLADMMVVWRKTLVVRKMKRKKTEQRRGGS